MNTELKLYTLNIGWRGSVAVAAENITEAKEIIFNTGLCDEEDLNDVVEKPFVKGVILVNYGDQ